jgi:preprotein translocase subunit SecG
VEEIIACLKNFASGGSIVLILVTWLLIALFAFSAIILWICQLRERQKKGTSDKERENQIN